MASLPPQSGPQAQHRRTSPTNRAEEADQSPQSISGDTSQSTEDPMHSPLLESSSTSQNPSSSTQSPSQDRTTQSNANHDSDNEPRKCWICFTDETEDTPLSSQWRSPCPCALTAHESCLLDWVADLENPKNRKRRSNTKILCPQCKSEIHIARPRSLALGAMRIVETIAGQLIIPGVVITLGGMVWAGAAAHGYYSLNLIFGVDDTERILHRDPATPAISSARINIGLPLIPVILLSSRVTYTEPFMPVLPLLFFGSYYREMDSLNADLWPPSAAMTFAVLPYIRVVYNKIYERVFTPLEQKWLKEVQPRAGETEEGNANQQNQDAWVDEIVGDEDGIVEELVMQLDVEVEIEDDDEDENEDRQPAADQAAPAPDIPRAAEASQGEAQDRDRNQNQNGQQNNAQNQVLANAQEEGVIIHTTRLADTILGALLFPTISAAMGQLLKLGLPKRLTQVSGNQAKPSLLQTRWGRSVVGGCLFVVLKDALVLYCRWKLAQSHRQRRVLNYDRKAGKVEEFR